MKALLPYYERELVYLNTVGRELAHQYPKLAVELGLGPEGSEDPHIRRLIQACALLNARTAKKLDDDYPEFTEALLGSLYPHFLHGIPSCSIVRVDDSDRQASPATLGHVHVVPRGTEMTSLAAGGAPCRFRTTADLALAPVTVTRAWFSPVAQVPPPLRLPARASARISIGIDSAMPCRLLPRLGLARLRLHVDGDALLTAALIDSLCLHTLETWVETEGQDRWRRLDRPALSLGGLEPDEALVPEPAHAHPAYRLLTEYFAFPDKFHFLDVDLAALGPMFPASARCFTLHVLLTGLQAESGPARVLRALSHQHLLAGCVPVVNLFRQAAAPVRITHRSAMYDVVPSRHEDDVEVYSIDAVQVLTTHGGKTAGVAYRPCYGLRHGEGGEGQRYWFDRHDDAGDRRHRMKIAFSDDDTALAGLEPAIASIDLTCSNGPAACAVGVGAPGGDLASETATGGVPIRLLRKPSAPLHFGNRDGTGWRLVAQLALNHRSLAQLDTFRDTLAVYDLARSGSSQRQIAGLSALTTLPATAWLRNRHGATLVHGTEIRLTLDEEAFAGSSLFVFAQVVSRFLGLYVHLNSFTRLVLISGQSGKELLRCEPRSGSLTLV
jgi:type VI secretion system protein ImpG